MNNAIGSCGPVIKAQGSACILPIKAFTVGEALTSGQWRCYNGGMYVVCKDFDGKLNYPDSKYFKGPYGLEDVLNGAIQPCAGDMLCLCPPIWGACNTDGSVCVPAYGLRACAWDYDPVLKEYRLYTSLKADNHIKPYEGSIANPKTWDGGYDVCGYLNRPVAKDLEGNIYYPGNVNTIFCGVSCAEVNNPDFRFEGGKLRVNFPYETVNETVNYTALHLINPNSTAYLTSPNPDAGRFIVPFLDAPKHLQGDLTVSNGVVTFNRDMVIQSTVMFSWLENQIPAEKHEVGFYSMLNNAVNSPSTINGHIYRQGNVTHRWSRHGIFPVKAGDKYHVEALIHPYMIQWSLDLTITEIPPSYLKKK